MAELNFIEQMKQKARENQRVLVFPESEDIRVLRAAEMITEERTATVILLGRHSEIAAAADQAGVSLSGIQIRDMGDKGLLDRYAARYTELRQAKGMTRERAERILAGDRITCGAVMVETGEADGMVAGAVHHTAEVLRPALQLLKMQDTFVSSFCIMDVPDCSYGLDGVFFFADCGLNQNPNPQELAQIAHSCGLSFKQLLGREPVIAMISHSTDGSACHELVDKVKQAVQTAKESWPDLLLDGEMQVDAAIVPEIGSLKMKGSRAAGRANILVFPDLDAGNAACKLVERLGKARMYGPILQGLRKPVNDLSRGCSASDIAGAAAITAVQAGAAAEETEKEKRYGAERNYNKYPAIQPA